jgi:hypothetical protein
MKTADRVSAVGYVAIAMFDRAKEATGLVTAIQTAGLASPA